MPTLTALCTMANPEHLKILKQGAKVWNRWREENPRAHFDLRELCLNGANLKDANFYGAHPFGADLGGSDLSGAYFNYANVSVRDS